MLLPCLEDCWFPVWARPTVILDSREEVPYVGLELRPYLLSIGEERPAFYL
jgi:hypothetical protein